MVTLHKHQKRHPELTFDVMQVTKRRFCRWQRTFLQIVNDELVFDEKRR
jgi:hypothetical protein